MQHWYSRHALLLLLSSGKPLSSGLGEYKRVWLQALGAGLSVVGYDPVLGLD